MSDKVVNALVLLKSVFDEHEVPFQIVGGLAATIHGGSRAVADIDLYIPKEFADRILPSLSSHISKPLAHYVEHGWDLEYFQLIYQDQKIEIGLSPGTKILNASTDEWVEFVTDYSQSVLGSYKGIEVPVMPVSELIKYKSHLGREVDLIDISELARASAP